MGQDKRRQDWLLSGNVKSMKPKRGKFKPNTPHTFHINRPCLPDSCAKHGKIQSIRYTVIYAQSHQKHKKLIILKAWVKALRRSLPIVIMQITIQIKKREGIKTIWVVSADYYPVQTPRTSIFDNSSMKLFFQRTTQNVWCNIPGSHLWKHIG